MKASKCFKLSALVFIALFSAASAREVTVLMRDSYGDGWNSAALRVSVNGSNLASNATLSSGSNSGTYRFNPGIGDAVSIYWVKGSYDSECAFAVYYTDDPPSPAFNPSSGAANNDVNALLVYKLYGSLSSNSTGTLLGSFTVTALSPRVTVAPASVLLPVGGTQTFTASFKNFDGPDKTVSWGVAGSNSALTAISSGGVLTVALDETAASFTVAAASNADPTLYGTAAVSVAVPYRIGTAAQLAAFADSINSGKNFNGRFVLLTADINLSAYGETYNGGKGWIPIGTSSNSFRGNFDGGGHVIRGLFINNAALSYAGLFGYIGSAAATGSVRNLGIEDANITGQNYVGGVTGYIRGYGVNVGGASQEDYGSDVENCYVTGTIKGSSYAGGIAGNINSWGYAGNCYSTAEVSVSSYNVGGISGYTDGLIRNCAALNPLVSGASYTGRVVGEYSQYATLGGNIAFAGILNKSGTDVWGNKGAALRDGADITDAEIYIDSTLGGRFAQAPWVTARGYLPGFGAPAAMPGHISNEPPTVTGVSVSPANAVVIKGRGQTVQFSALVSGTNKPPQAVAWSVSGGSAGTSISAGGLLTVAAGETAELLTVKAVSAFNTEVFGTAAVAVITVPGYTEADPPVERYGRLSVKGNRLVNRYGDTVQLRGMSFFWSMASEGRNYYNADVVNWLADDWKVSVVRAAMGIDETWIDTVTRSPLVLDTTASGYLALDRSGGVSNKKRVTDVVDAAIARGIYVIIDWHSHKAHLNTAAAKEFFEEMAAKYKDYPNIIYEIYNEPEEYPWSTVKTYSQTIVNAIRAIDPNNVIIIGTPTWSQDVDIATASPVTGDNLVYSLHFYAASHKAELRSRASAALSNGKALFVSEFGTCYYDGDIPVDTASTTTWLNFLSQNKTSWVNWSICNKAEAASVLKPGTRIDGNWTDNDLTLSGRYIRGKLIAAHEAEFLTGSKSLTLAYTAGAGGRIVGPASQTVAAGADGAEVLALPDNGYTFVKWSDDKTANPRQDKAVSGNIAVSAVFAPIVSPPASYKLTYIIPEGYGRLIGNAAQSVKPGENGEEVYVLDTALGYGFREWSDGSTANPRQDKNVSEDITVTAIFGKTTSAVSSPNRVIPQPQPNEEATVIAPMVILAGEFTAGPNPVSRSSGAVKFYRQGKRISNCELRIYDATGNVISKVKIRDSAMGNQSRRKVGAWDLTDRKGRIVSEGTYLVKGVIKTQYGKKEKVSVIIGVR